MLFFFTTQHSTTQHSCERKCYFFCCFLLQIDATHPATQLAFNKLSDIRSGKDEEIFSKIFTPKSKTNPGFDFLAFYPVVGQPEKKTLAVAFQCKSSESGKTTTLDNDTVLKAYNNTREALTEDFGAKQDFVLIFFAWRNTRKNILMPQPDLEPMHDASELPVIVCGIEDLKKIFGRNFATFVEFSSPLFKEE